MKRKQNNKVAIIGRPNVGKSSLFNRLVQKRLSVTSDISGTTRDRIIFTTEWLGNYFDLIDTGGFSQNLKEDNFQVLINQQIEIAIKEADLIIFLVSAKEGVINEDRIIAKKLKKINKPIILAINKVDNIEIKSDLYDFYKLGYQDPVATSSIHGIGISELLDRVVQGMPTKNENAFENTLRIGIVGKPNVGKSTLINTILNDNRVIVSDISGTTRDSVDTLVKHNKEQYIFTDTAGLKKNKDSLSDIEYYSELRTNFTILNSDIVLLILDVNQNLNKIDEQILSVLKEEYKPTVILVNKIDLLTQEELKEFHKKIANEFKFFNDPYIVNISAISNKNINKIFDAIRYIDESLEQKIPIPKLNQFLMDIQMIKSPPRHNGINVKLSYITYSNTRFPHFIIFSNYPDYVHFSYKRFIENNLKSIFAFKGIPIKISFRKK